MKYRAEQEIDRGKLMPCPEDDGSSHVLPLGIQLARAPRLGVQEQENREKG